MIPVGTLCIVTYSVRPQFLGRECVVVQRIPKDAKGHDNIIRFNDGEQVFGADVCLLPLNPPEMVSEERHKAIHA